MRAFHNPNLLSRHRNFFIYSTIRPDTYLVVKKVLAKRVIASLLLGFLIASMVLGVVIAFETNRSDVGAGVAAGGFALVTAIQGLLSWIYQ
jgi:hypothetical protein